MTSKGEAPDSVIICEPRAATLLFNFLLTNKRRGRFYLPANICPVLLFVFAGARVPFTLVDVDPFSLCIDANIVLDRLREDPEHCAGVLYVRSYGIENDASTFFSALKSFDEELVVIDDRCLCLPDLKAEPIEHVDLSLYSTGAKKSVDIGSGGFAVLGPGRDYHRHRRPEGRSFDKDAEARLHSLLDAAVANKTAFDGDACCDLDWLALEDCDSPRFSREDYLSQVASALPAAVLQKSQLNAIYKSRLPKQIQFPERLNQWRFNIIVEGKDKLIEKLFSAGLFASNHYASLAPAWPGSSVTPNCDNWKRNVVNLFNDKYYTAEKALKTADIVSAHVRAIKPGQNPAS